MWLIRGIATVPLVYGVPSPHTSTNKSGFWFAVCYFKELDKN